MENLIHPAIQRSLRRVVKRGYQSVRRLTKITRKRTSLNIGGGPFFDEPGWYNLDEAASGVNPHPFRLSPECVFPGNQASIHIVYTSHTLEHLDSRTVFRVLSETYRVLKDNGRLIIKIPDFDRALDSWKRRDAGFFVSAFWDYDSVTNTWENRQICDCLDHRAAMLFCGFWNDEYGDHFSRRILKDPAAYHGPPVIGVEGLRRLSVNHTPSELSAELRRVVMEKEKNPHFNHQSAWSRQELETLLASAGFGVRSFDKVSIIARCGDIPGIESMKEQSVYCWAEKR